MPRARNVQPEELADALAESVAEIVPESAPESVPEIVPEDANASVADRVKAATRAQARAAKLPRDPKDSYALAEGSEWYAVPGTRSEVALTVTEQGHYYATMIGSGRTRSIPLIALTVLEDHGLL